MATSELRYNVGTLRASGFNAMWVKNSAGAPIIAAKKRGSSGPFYYIHKQMWERSKLVGLAQAFDEFKVLGLASSV